MSFELPTKRTSQAEPARWSGAAFLVEAMLLLVFLMASLAVFTQMFAAATERANQSQQLTEAAAAASGVAERFSANPLALIAQPEFSQGDQRVVCEVVPEQRPGGVLYHATISVYAADAGPGAEPLYSVTTAKYEGGV